MMASNQSLDKKPKGHLRNESMLKAMPPDILKELARRRLEEIEIAKQNLANGKNRSLADTPDTKFS
jgi:DNA-binding TFAR19-related protein (PDSD5 family)